jgi:hypothetical protein
LVRLARSDRSDLTGPARQTHLERPMVQTDPTDPANPSHLQGLWDPMDPSHQRLSHRSDLTGPARQTHLGCPTVQMDPTGRVNPLHPQDLWDLRCPAALAGLTHPEILAAQMALMDPTHHLAQTVPTVRANPSRPQGPWDRPLRPTAQTVLTGLTVPLVLRHPMA